ncbi:MAG: molybdate ABC transporter substrate-binding protein [Gammaproteobacteria bacterium]|nr:molybdate ABC transporter substrate-binding protein [Gammaproteobacteria bacterium]
MSLQKSGYHRIGLSLFAFFNLLLWFTPSMPLRAEEILVATASNFAVPMEQITTDFERQFGHNVTLVFGSSGRLFAQIQHGAPFQLFLSADQEKPAALESAGYIVNGSRFTYARGHLVLWSNDIERAIEGPAALQQDWSRLALANPELAPYGRAAQEVLTRLGLLESTRSRWIMGENIAQAYQFVATSNADLGFVALSQLVGGESGFPNRGWLVPTEYYGPILQDAVLLTSAQSCAACRQLFDYLQSEPVQQQLTRFGYLRP